MQQVQPRWKQRLAAINWKAVGIILARILLGMAGMAFYLFIAIFGSIIGIMATVANLADSYVFRYSNTKYINSAEKWGNRTFYMLWNGLWKCLKFIFVGGDTDLLSEFWHQTSGPLIHISGQIWDEGRRRRF